jgi:hypothetical protein
MLAPHVAEQSIDMPPPCRIDAASIPSAWAGGLTHGNETKIPDDEVVVCIKERDKSGLRRGSGPKRWGPPEDSVLKVALIIVEDRDAKPSLVAEPAIERALANACRTGDIVHGHRSDAVGSEQHPRGLNDAGSVPCRIRSLDWRLSENWQLHLTFGL